MIFATAGSKLYIGTAMGDPGRDLTESDFSGEAWTEIKHLSTLGSVGDTAEEIAEAIIDRGRMLRLKGTRNAGVMEVTVNLDGSDAGQLAVIAAEKTDGNFAFRLVFDDAPAGGTPSERLFMAMVGAVNEALDAANNTAKLNVSLWVNSNVVRIAAEGA